MIIFNKEVNKENSACFLHIPKTGGKTLWNLLSKQQDDIFVWHNRFFKELQKPISFFTMLRDPVDRVISYYYYLRRYERSSLYYKVKDMSLQEFVDYVQNEEIENKPYKKKDMRNIRYRNVNLATRYISGGDPEDLEKAKKNINNHFSFVGFTDMYVESLFFLKKIFDWEFSSIPKKNQTKNRPKLDEIPKEIIKSIEHVNQHDIELYKWAKKNFIKKIESIDTDTERELNEWINQFKN
ncbi:sulfotransferase family 2 domain-containing protein [Aquibacillus albus]|uniref:Sulfotransferase family protein n=1 Tax=Aquibacillus albus TaxID=1168171 RepID=A0ABS2N6B4_9BACI|nr:hypothetical protein [Aquibacillus albus]